MITKKQKERAHQDAEQIFTKILPEYGMTERAEQIKLCHDMLDAMLENRIQLSDAGTGIGKTFAYLAAGILFNQCRIAAGEPRQPILISTATVALQKAVQEEYLPFLSQALMDTGYIREPLLSVIRKGKSRYVCDKRLRARLQSIRLEKKNRQAAHALLSLYTHLDMDEATGLSGYDRRQVAVPRSCGDCREACRYQRFLRDCCSPKYLFQICNHNLLLADAIHARCGKHPILPAYCALIVDEAHKLPGTARQMFGRALGYDDVLSLAHGLRAEHYPLAAQNLICAFRPVIQGMAADTEAEAAAFAKARPRLLTEGLHILTAIRRTIGDELSRPVYLELSRMIATLALFTDEESDVILYTDKDDRQRPTLCAAAADLSTQMENTLWSLPLPILLTSGTLAVGRDFSRFKAEACLGEDLRITEAVFPSPFDYTKNCLMYVPYTVPAYEREGYSAYCEAVAREIASLVEISRGHALALFTSYAAMSAVKELLQGCCPYPLFTMSRNNSHITQAFKQSGNGVLLATGSAWEGMDFPGDLVSMLIIPRLPFPIPDAFSDHLKARFDSLPAFIRAVALPDMQIRLRQGFGRAIRLETDACVVAILDERALRGRRYHEAVRAALPDMPITGSRKQVERFLRSVKDAGFFAEV